MTSENKKKYAFISYSHKDERIAKWLQRQLEAYRLPTGVNNECEDTRYLRPVFRDRTDLNSGKLSDEICRNLESSKFLIVLCSDNSAESFWVNEEIRLFISYSKIENVIPVLVDGSQYSLLPYSLTEYYREHPQDELIAIDLYSEGKEIALIRIISRMLSLEFNVLWDRHKRNKRRKILFSSLISIFTLFIIYWFGTPITIDIIIQEAEHNLPYPSESRLKVGNAEYKLDTLTSTVHIASLPGYLRLRTVPITLEATYYHRYTYDYRFGYGIHNNALIRISRDDSFSIFAGTVYDQDGNGLKGVSIAVGTVCSETDEHGNFRIELPLGLQAETQIIRLQKDGYEDHIREDECPGDNLGFVLKTKCGI